VLLSMVASIGSAIALGMRYSRVFPTNLGLLGLFTAGESVIIGEIEKGGGREGRSLCSACFTLSLHLSLLPPSLPPSLLLPPTGLITSRYKADAVLLAALQTAAAVTGLSLFAFRKNQKYDLTAFGSVLFSGLLIMLMSSVFAFFFKVKIPEVVMGGFGALLFSVFLIYDTQRIVGGGATQLDDRDYVLGAMDLYLVGGEGGRERGRVGRNGSERAAVPIRSRNTYIFPPFPPSLPPSFLPRRRTSRASLFTCFESWLVRTGGSSSGETGTNTSRARKEREVKY
jgi:hypothetical protein